MAMTNQDYINIARAISAYGQQAFTDAQQLAGTGIVGGAVTLSGAQIVSEREDFYGTIRFDKAPEDVTYLGDGQTMTNTRVNVATETESDGEVSTFEMEQAEYIKTYRTHGAEDFLVTPVLTRRGGAIQKIGEQYGRTRAVDADKQLVAALQGIARSEVLRANKIGSDNATRTADTGCYGVKAESMANEDGAFFYDVNTKAAVATANIGGSGTLVGPDSKGKGAAVFENVIDAITYAYSDVDVPFFYLVVDPLTYRDIQVANLLDEDHIPDGNVRLPTALGGMFRIYRTRTFMGNYAVLGGASGPETEAEDNKTQSVNAGSTRTSFLLRPEAVAMVPMGVNRPVEFDRDASTGRGAGKDELWLRWGGITHPYGYSWVGYKGAFARNTDIPDGEAVSAAYGGKTAAANADTIATDGSTRRRGLNGTYNWKRVESVLSLRALPIFHA